MHTKAIRSFLRAGRLAAAATLVLAAACGGGGDSDEAGADDTSDTSADASSGTTAPGGEDGAPSEHVSYVASAVVDEVAVYPEPDAAEPIEQLGNPNPAGAPLVFLVEGTEVDGEWIHVNLPIRPNGSTGWVRASDVDTAENHFKVTVELSAYRLTVTEAGEPVLEAPIGVGTAETPTPDGVYYIKELQQPSDPNGPYGAYAYGLSGFSEALTTFNGSEPVLGIHGTNEPEAIGTDVSSGCIRMTNEDITRMTELLPLGTPVEIVA